MSPWRVRCWAEAGFPDGKGFRTFEMLVPYRGHARLTMEIVQEMWRKNLGLTATFNVQEWGVYIDSENNGQYDVVHDGWNNTHPHLFSDLNRTGSPLSHYLWSNPKYDALVRDAAWAKTSEARNAVYAQMEAILAREMPVIPLHFEVVTFLMHPAVRGWRRQPAEPASVAISVAGRRKLAVELGSQPERFSPELRIVPFAGYHRTVFAPLCCGPGT